LDPAVRRSVERTLRLARGYLQRGQGERTLQEVEHLREKMSPWPIEHQQEFLSQLASLEAYSKVSVHTREGDRLWKLIEWLYATIRHLLEDTSRHGPTLEEHVNCKLQAVEILMADERDPLSAERIQSNTDRSEQATQDTAKAWEMKPTVCGALR
jgi:hypothetical protein